MRSLDVDTLLAVRSSLLVRVRADIAAGPYSPVAVRQTLQAVMDDVDALLRQASTVAPVQA